MAKAIEFVKFEPEKIRVISYNAHKKECIFYYGLGLTCASILIKLNSYFDPTNFNVPYLYLAIQLFVFMIILFMANKYMGD